MSRLCWGTAALVAMAITLQTVLPQKVLPRAPSPNAAAPNAGVRSAITQFIPASREPSLDGTPTDETTTADSAYVGASSSRVNLTRGLSGSSQNQTYDPTSPLRSPGLAPMARRKSMSAGAGSRRNIAHSSRVLGTDKKTQDAIALSKLSNGKVDVSFEATAGVQPPLSPSQSKGKSKAREGVEGENGQTALFDVDLESGQQPTAGPSTSPRAGGLLRLGSHTMPWKKVRINPTPAYEATSDDIVTTTPHRDRRDDSLDFSRSPMGAIDHKSARSPNENVDDDDEEQLLYAGADDEDGPDLFSSGNFDYAALQDEAELARYDSAVGFEAVTYMEGTWMAVSGAVVAVLMVVAILISIDIIDWPGDGIGNN